MADTAQKIDIETVLKESIQRAIENLEVDDLYAVDRFASYLSDLARDPVLKALVNAPYDDEPVTPEEEALIEEAREDVRAGRIISHEEIVKSLDERS